LRSECLLATGTADTVLMLVNVTVPFAAVSTTFTPVAS